LIDLAYHPHRRFNPLTGRWVLVSPHRADRPWQGAVEKISTSPLPQYAADCYLCPGNARAGGHRNPHYESTFVFDNDFPALRADTPQRSFTQHPLLCAETEPGICRVVCFSPRHDLRFSLMDLPSIAKVVSVWRDQYRELAALPCIRHVQIFENRGEMMGASNPHPHCQIWAQSTVPDEVALESARQAEYARDHASCLLCDYLSIELKAQERVICENQGFVALVPFWAVWPFEVMILSRNHRQTIGDFSGELPGDSPEAFGDILQQVTTRFDRLFDAPFPYSFGLHQLAEETWHFHAHFLPPLLRSATIRKFLVGFELLAMPQRDITPEQAAIMIRRAGAQPLS